MEALAATKRRKEDDKARRMEKEEEERLIAKTAELAREFRRQYNSMRTYSLGQDRFLHTIWWLDGCGTADLVGPDGETVYGTGRLYIQAPNETDVKRIIEEEESLDEAEMEEKRKAEEPQGERLEAGEWAAIDTPEQVSQGSRSFQIRDSSSPVHLDDSLTSI
jgi:bromodomain adjacent to zinc finger domain protein 1A